MDHLPVSGAAGSLMQLARVSSQRKVYTHINNTNPMLVEDSDQRAAVERSGLTVGTDGMSFLV
jgi:pyrroloquinoline quinone biosynthesis protein B